ncbi:MAG: ankyrin repeat domain-containing protein [Pseudomonadota bacterium]|nr:ankyrin repeat domain-containing protein [Pseudomonadota bacterium]
MPDPRTPRLAWLALPGLLLQLAMSVAGPFALAVAVPGVLLLALAPAARPWAQRLPLVAKPLLAGMLLAVVLLAWPLWRLAHSGSLLAAVASSAAAGLLLLAVWRSWALWPKLLSGAVDDLAGVRRLIDSQPAAWRGLIVAVPLALLLALPVALSVPGLLEGAARWAASGLAAVLGLLPVLLTRPARQPAAAERQEQHLRNADRLTLESLWDQAADPLPAAEQEDVDARPPRPVESAADDPAIIAKPVPDPAQLYAAARAGKVDRALALLADGADANAAPPAQDRDQRSLAQLAVVLPDLRLLRALIERGVALDAMSGQFTPLLAATRDSWHGRPEAVMTLLANGADPRARDGDGRSPLHHAARSTDPGVAALLLDAGAEIDALDHGGQSPLAIACHAGNWRLAKFLIERGASIQPRNGQPVLIAAATTEDDDPAGAGLLLRHKADVNGVDRSGHSALHLAAEAGHLAIVQTLIDAGADIGQRDGDGNTAWLLAARGGHGEVMASLLDAGADVQTSDGQGRNALMLMLISGRATPTLVDWLRTRGIATDQCDAGDASALDIAIAQSRWDLVAAIDPNYPVPGALGDGPEPIPQALPPQQLADALAVGDADAARRLLPLLAPGELDRALLAAATDHPEQIALLIRLGATADARNIDGDAAMFVLFDRIAAEASRQAVQTLLASAASPAGRGGLARLLAAALNARLGAASAEPLALELIARGADIFAAEANGHSPLVLAIRLAWPQLIAELLARGSNPNQADPRGLTPLHLAAGQGNLALIKQLLTFGAQPAQRASDGQTAMGVALACGQREAADWLDWRGWPHPGRVLQGSDLPNAAASGGQAAVERLLMMGFAVDSRDAQGCSALLRAAGSGHLALVEQLLQAGADPDLVADSGASALSAAISRGHQQVVERLLAAGAAVDARLPGGATMLMLAAALGSPEITTRLLVAGADIAASDEEGLQALHCAALFAFASDDQPRVLALFDGLLLAGADPDAQTRLGVTPLLLLLGARAEPDAPARNERLLLAVCERLLDVGAGLQARDQRGFAPMHLAALHGLADVVRFLLRAGADPNQRDQLNRSPREIAQMRGFLDIAAEFPAATANPGSLSMARLLRERRGD